MADSAFARRQLEKQGWKEGDGLGKKRNGISKPIKVSLKMDKTGVGHDPGTEFKDHWWLRVFNDAASSITKTRVDEVAEDQTPQSKLYKGFVKGTILSNGKEEKDSDCSSDDDEMERNPDPFSIPTLDDIHRYCGGATGHRAATLGIKMKGKLSRAAEQERLFNEKGKKNPGVDVVQPENGDIMEPLKEKKKKKKRKTLEPVEQVETEEGTLPASLEGNIGDEGHGKNRRRHLKESENCDISDEVVDDCIISENIQDIGTDEIMRKKTKKKKKRKTESMANESPTEHEIPVKSRKTSKHSKDDHCETVENTETEDMSERQKKKKKKKKDKD